MEPNALLDLVKDNIVVQWFLVVVVILTVGTQTATRLKGPIGSVARWFQSIGEKRVNREAEERRRARQALLHDAREGREWAENEIRGLKEALEETNQVLDGLQRLIRQHLGWDYDRIAQLISMGVRPGDIPTPPPMRIPWRMERTDTRELQSQQVNGHHAPESGESLMVVRAEN